MPLARAKRALTRPAEPVAARLEPLIPLPARPLGPDLAPVAVQPGARVITLTVKLTSSRRVGPSPRSRPLYQGALRQEPSARGSRGLITVTADAPRRADRSR